MFWPIFEDIPDLILLLVLVTFWIGETISFEARITAKKRYQNMILKMKIIFDKFFNPLQAKATELQFPKRNIYRRNFTSNVC